MTIIEQLEKIKLIPVAVLDNAADAQPLAKALIDGGLPCVEVTFRTDAAAESIRSMRTAFPEMLVGAGTVLTVEQAGQAIEAGAQFIVSPGFNPEVVKFCLSRKLPVVPGISSPTEIEAALAYGLTVLKFFPAEAAGGLPMIKALSAPYCSVRFIPTGGINEQNITAYLQHKAVLACGGSWMLPKDLIAAHDFKRITDLTAAAVQRVAACRQPECTAQSKQTAETAQMLVATGSYAGRGQSVAEKAAAPVSYPEHPRVVTFGEIMLRLAPPGYTRFIQTETFGATYGGAEANVAVSLANYGIDASFVTKLPAHEIGQAAVNALRRFGVHTGYIVRGGSRIGIYYLEKGASQRPSKVIYDRLPSSISEAEPSDFQWEKIFKGVSWFHFTGITPALSNKTAQLCREACRTAKALGLTVSCDLNYRKKLWSKEKAQEVMQELCGYVDVCIANEEDAADVFGIVSTNTDVHSGTLNKEGYEEVAAALTRRFGFRSVAITLRESLSASDNNWSALLYESGKAYYSKKYAVRIVDRVGGGDSFGAGLIYAALKSYAPQEQIEFAAAASCLKHSIEGDFNATSVDEVTLLANGNASGRVQR
ncbi:MAG: KHG/KDPG aldolase/sugar kinase fusion protein [Treponema sp.]